MADLNLGENPKSLFFSPPTENTDGTPIVGALNYKLYKQNAGGSWSHFFDIVGALQVGDRYEVPLPFFPEGTHVISMAAVDSDGDESVKSNTAEFVIGRRKPRKPTILAALIL
jgi:hypothetical protein